MGCFTFHFLGRCVVQVYNTSVHLESSNHPTRTHALAYLCQSQHTTPSRPVPEGIQARRASRAAGSSIKPAQMHTRPPPAPSIPAAHPHCDPLSPSRPGPAARRHRRLSFSPRLMATRSRMWRWVRGALAWVLRNGPRARARARAHRLATESARLPARGRTTTRHHCYPHPREVCSRPAAWCATASSAAHHYLNASSFRGAG